MLHHLTAIIIPVAKLVIYKRHTLEDGEKCNKDLTLVIYFV